MVKDKLISLKNWLSEQFQRFDLHNNELKKRIITSAILLPAAVYAIYFSKNLFLLLTLSIAILMVFEWCDMSKNMPDQTKWRTIGFFLVVLPIFSVIKLRLIDSDIVFWMFLIIWSTDISAYFIGRLFGGKKLAPAISPGKTWSGLVGGLVGAAIIGMLSSLMFVGSATFFVIISIILSLISQASDLFESKFKRIFGVKDSSKMIPGHGGILDRLDAMIFTAPTLLFLVTIFSKKFGI